MTATELRYHERATQYSRSTGSEDVDLQLDNNSQEEILDKNHVYTTKSFYNNDDRAYLSPTASNTQRFSTKKIFHSFLDSYPAYNMEEPTLDFSSVDAYRHVQNVTKRVLLVDEKTDRRGSCLHNINDPQEEFSKADTM